MVACRRLLSTDLRFAEFCAEHPDLSFEVSASGEISAAPPAFSLTSIRNREIISQLDRWASQEGSGVVSDSSGGFVLPNGARRSPDASWIAREEIAALSAESVEGYWHLYPPSSSNFALIQTACRFCGPRCGTNGARLGWMIDAEARTVEVYRLDREPEVVSADSSHGFIHGEGPIVGFVLNLSRVWDPLTR